jgi:acyl carrier protein
MRDPAVRACAVIPVPGPSGVQLVAYVVGDADLAALRTAAAVGLPAHQVPSAFVTMPSLPLMTNGKVDLSGLPAPTAAVVSSAPPRGPIEERIAAVACEVLGLDEVGRFDDLVDLGANSLQVMRILSRLRNRHGDVLSPRDFAEARTVAALAWAAGSGTLSETLPPLVPMPGAAVVAGPGERRLWFLDQLKPEAGVAYNIPMAFRLRGPLDREALRAAVGDVLHHHERLRTGFAYRNKALRATVDTDATLPIPVIGLTASEAGERAAIEYVNDFAATHLDLAAPPLVRAQLLRFAADDHIFAMIFHHTVCDGLSAQILERDLAAAYATRSVGERPRFTTPLLRYNDFARWRAEFDASTSLSETMARLAGAPVVLDLPTDHTRPATMAYRGRRIRRESPAGLLKAMQELGRDANSTANGVALSAWGIVLATSTGRDDLLVASPTAGRPHPDLEEVVGFFANTVVHRLRVDTSASFRTILATVYADALAALELEYVAFERLVAEIAPGRDLSRPPLVQTAFVYQGSNAHPTRWGELDATLVEVDNGTAKFDLTVEADEIDGEIVATAEYRTDLFAESTVVGLLDRWMRLLTAVTAAPDATVSDLL